MTKKTSPAAKPVSTKDAALAPLRCEGGATLDEVVEATGWLRHSARAVFTGLRKNGFAIEKQKADGTTRYSITAEPGGKPVSRLDSTIFPCSTHRAGVGTQPLGKPS